MLMHHLNTLLKAKLVLFTILIANSHALYTKNQHLVGEKNITFD